MTASSDDPVRASSLNLDETLTRICRAIAKREAKNFYYSFVALPPPRRNAICAIYAFMRKADDLSDDESITRGAAQSTQPLAGSVA
jgi:phytoene/squalene synthetase